MSEKVEAQVADEVKDVVVANDELDANVVAAPKLPGGDKEDLGGEAHFDFTGEEGTDVAVAVEGTISHIDM